MPMTFAKLYSYGKNFSLYSNNIYDVPTNQTLADFISKIEQFKVMVDAFLTGEDNANEVIDRLSEIVAAIAENKDLINNVVNGSLKTSDIINDLVTGGVDKALSAEQGKILKELIDQLQTISNSDILEKIGENDSGQLTFDGRLVEGQTGIAFGTSIVNANDYTGKLQIILEEITDNE